MINPLTFVLILLGMFFIAWWSLKKCCDWLYTGNQGYKPSLIALISGGLASLLISIVIKMFFLSTGDTGLSAKVLESLAVLLIVSIIYARVLLCPLGKAFVIALLSSLMSMVIYIVILASFLFITGQGTGGLGMGFRTVPQAVSNPTAAIDLKKNKIEVLDEEKDRAKEQHQNKKQKITATSATTFKTINYRDAPQYQGETAIIVMTSGETREGLLGSVNGEYLELQTLANDIVLQRNDINNIMIIKTAE